MNDEVTEYFESLPVEKNVGSDERWLSMFGSGVLLTAGLMRGSPLFLLGAAGLGFRALSGYCPLYGAMGTQRIEVAGQRVELEGKSTSKNGDPRKAVSQSKSK